MGSKLRGGLELAERILRQVGRKVDVGQRDPKLRILGLQRTSHDSQASRFVQISARLHQGMGRVRVDVGVARSGLRHA